MKRVISLAVVFITMATTVAVLAASANAPATDVTGNWKLTVETPNGTGNPTVTFKQDGENLTGTYKGRMGDQPLKGTIKGNNITFGFKVNAQGQELQIEYTGTVDGDTMKGKVKFGEMGEGSFTGKKE